MFDGKLRVTEYCILHEIVSCYFDILRNKGILQNWCYCVLCHE